MVHHSGQEARYPRSAKTAGKDLKKAGLFLLIHRDAPLVAQALHLRSELGMVPIQAAKAADHTVSTGLLAFGIID
jgi:hypothetical protein